MKANKFFVIAACLLVVACDDYREGEVVPFTFAELFDDKELTAEADGESQTVLVLSMRGNIPKDKAVIELRTTKGTFLESKESTVQINLAKEIAGSTVDRKGMVHLISPNQVGEGVITAKFADYSKTKKITFIQAYPEEMLLKSSSVLLKRGYEDSVTVTVQLTRKSGKGKPTPNNPVVLSVKNEQGKAVGFVNPATALSNAEGTATFTVTLGDTLYMGNLTLTASVSSKTDSIRKTITLKTIP